MRLVAITGSIGCGKTTISNQLRSLGFVVWDIDGWVKTLYNKKTFLKDIEKVFPQVFKDGVLYKRDLRNLVFNNPKELKKLEDIIHPMLKKQLKQHIRVFAKYEEVVFIDVALLFEMGWDKYCYKIILADVPCEVAKNRVMARDKISAKDFEKINNKQIKNIDKQHLSDIVINTDISENMLRKNLIEIVELL